jgi:indole-3-glycerol phosphate synthase
MSTALDRIIADKRAWVSAAKSKRALAQIREEAAFATAVRGFAKTLLAARSAKRYGLIAELKKASPSKGLIRADFDVTVLARAYAAGGATCLSVLTDVPYFQGDDAYLQQARAAVPLPLLRKDFIIDAYQVYEARALGADCILLIMAALEDYQAQELFALAASLQLDVLVEVHDQAELERALALKPGLIGINNRNLKTLEVDVHTTRQLAPLVPQGALIIGESGLSCKADLDSMADLGVTTFLVGEALMRQDNVQRATQELLGTAL